MTSILLVAAATFFLAVQLITLAIAGWRCRPRVVHTPADAQMPGITVVRPLCGIETFSIETLEAAFAIDYPTFELLFCVARTDDPILPLVREAMAAHPAVPSRLLIGDDVISINPK